MLTIAMATLAAGSVNQDQVAHVPLGHCDVLLVADGAGGISGGGRASQLLVDGLALVAEQVARGAECCAAWLQKMDSELFCDPVAGESTAVLLVVSQGAVFGASIGDSEAWLVHEGQSYALTARQMRKPLLGSGQALPVSIPIRMWSGTLLAGSDGLFGYVPCHRLTQIVSAPTSANLALRLCEQAKLASGSLVDDTSVITCSKPQ